MNDNTTANANNANSGEATCPSCNMPQSEWRGNNGNGCQIGEKTYCCQGCATGTGCTCA